jgi:glycosyltransferase involved in cell wall biosynthesis
MRRHLPVVSWQHNAYLKPWNLRLLRVMQKRSALWVGDSRLVTDMTAERLSIAQDRLFLWQIFRADSAAPLARPWQAGEVLRIGSLGRLHRAKGYDVLIAALALLRQRGFVPDTPFHIEIAGEGTLLGELTAQAHAAGVSDWISFPGFAENPRQWLSTLHLYCQPSRREGLCIAVHEAMQAGLPVIASRVGEMPYSIEDPGCGRLVDAENPQQLAAALEAMLIRPAELASIGQRARLRVLDRFSDQKFTQAGRTILDRLAALTPQA